MIAIYYLVVFDKYLGLHMALVYYNAGKMLDIFIMFLF